MQTNIIHPHDTAIAGLRVLGVGGDNELMSSGDGPLYIYNQHWTEVLKGHHTHLFLPWSILCGFQVLSIQLIQISSMNSKLSTHGV